MSSSTPRAPMVITHLGGVRFAAQVGAHQVFVDQPARAGGDDTAPSPVELLGVSLGTCVAFYVQQFCQSRNIPHDGMRIEVQHRGEKNPARITGFSVRVQLPAPLSAEQAVMLDRVIHSCPAHNTLTLGATVAISVETPATVA